MQDKEKGNIHTMGSEMADLSTEYTRQRQQIPSIIASAASALMLTLMGINDTLEEIRDAIKEK